MCGNAKQEFQRASVSVGKEGGVQWSRVEYYEMGKERCWGLDRVVGEKRHHQEKADVGIAAVIYTVAEIRQAISIA